MSAIMEKNIPAGASEILLKTAGRYCDKDIRVTSHFRIVKGTDYTFADNNFCIPLSEKPKLVIWRATDDTQKKISAKVKAGKDNTRHYTVGGIMNFAKDIDTTSYTYTEAKLNYNSFLACYQYYSSKIDLNSAKETRVFYEDGYAKIATLNFSESFDDGATPAEYEWTAYYWDE